MKVAAQSFRANPEMDTVTAITELGVGEALVSTLQDKGIPAPVERVLVRPPHSRMGKATMAERKIVMERDPNLRRYKDAVDPRSAHEVLAERVARRLELEAQAKREEEVAREAAKTRKSSSRESASEAFLKSMARAAGSSVGRKLFRGLLGSLLK